jgi:O-antigen/teichoic acid export membrane protein
MDILLLVPFLYAWQPFYYSLAGKSEAPRIFARVTHYFLLLLACIFLAMQVFQSQILHFLGRGKFDAAGPVISLLVLAALFNGIQYCVSAGIHLRKKLVTEMGIMAAAACLNIFLNFLLIPKFGAKGAAGATAAAFGLFLIGSFWVSQRAFPVPYLWRRGLLIVALTACAFAALMTWQAMPLRILILCVFGLVGPLLDLARHGELRMACRLVSAKLFRVPSLNRIRQGKNR